MPGRNAAQRLKALVERAVHLPNQLTMLDGLSMLFDYQPVDLEREHALRLEAIHLQLDLATKQLSTGGFPEDLYISQFSRVRAAFRPALLQQGFDHVRGNMDESVRLCFSWCAYALEDEGDLVGQDDANRLAEQLRALLNGPEMATLSPSVRGLLSSHLDALLTALSLLDLEGATPLRRAAKAAAVELVAHADEVDEALQTASPEQAGFIKKCGAALRRSMEAASNGGKAVDGLEKMIKFATERGPQALQLADAAIKQLGA